MQAIALKDAQLKIDGEVYVIPRAWLFVSTDAQGWKTWTVKAEGRAVDWPIRVRSKPGTFTGGIYSGKCFPASSHNLVGTGELSGF